MIYFLDPAKGDEIGARGGGGGGVLNHWLVVLLLRAPDFNVSTTSSLVVNVIWL